MAVLESETENHTYYGLEVGKHIIVGKNSNFYLFIDVIIEHLSKWMEF